MKRATIIVIVLITFLTGNTFPALGQGTINYSLVFEPIEGNQWLLKQAGPEANSPGLWRIDSNCRSMTSPNENFDVSIRYHALPIDYVGLEQWHGAEIYYKRFGTGYGDWSEYFVVPYSRPEYSGGHILIWTRRSRSGEMERFQDCYFNLTKVASNSFNDLGNGMYEVVLWNTKSAVGGDNASNYLLEDFYTFNPYASLNIKVEDVTANYVPDTSKIYRYGIDPNGNASIRLFEVGQWGRAIDTGNLKGPYDQVLTNNSAASGLSLILRGPTCSGNTCSSNIWASKITISEVSAGQTPTGTIASRTPTLSPTASNTRTPTLSPTASNTRTSSVTVPTGTKPATRTPKPSATAQASKTPAWTGPTSDPASGMECTGGPSNPCHVIIDGDQPPTQTLPPAMETALARADEEQVEQFNPVPITGGSDLEIIDNRVDQFWVSMGATKYDTICPVDIPEMQGLPQIRLCLTYVYLWGVSFLGIQIPLAAIFQFAIVCMILKIIRDR